MCDHRSKVFPLLCTGARQRNGQTVGCRSWSSVHPALLERDCVFITADKLEKTIWYITRHEPERWFVEMLKYFPGVTACRLEIQRSENGDGCFADVTYSHTSMGAAGDEFVTQIHGRCLQKTSMQAWEKAIKTHCFDSSGRSAYEHDRTRLTMTLQRSRPFGIAK